MKSLIKKLFKYTLGGGISLALKLGLTFLFTEYVFDYYLISYVSTLVIVIITGFFYNFYITFENKGKKRVKFFKYLTSIGFFNLADILLVFITTDLIGLHYMLSILIISVLIFLSKFVVFNFIFKK